MQQLNSPELSAFWENLSGAAGSCLMLDYDGTLAPFTELRDQAHPYPGVAQVLRKLVDLTDTRLAIISGRSVTQLPELLGLNDGLEFWGSHGAEMLSSSGSYRSYKSSDKQRQGLASALEAVAQLVPEQQIELKQFSLAIHWRGRNPAEAEHWKEKILPKWRSVAEQAMLAVHPFNGGLEIRPEDVTKATAVNEILSSLSQGFVISYLGDDLTDEDAFEILLQSGLGILVGDEPRQTKAQAFLHRPEEVLAFLERWVAICR